MNEILRDLYNELWGKWGPLIKHFEVEVPLANYGLCPSHKTDMKSSIIGTFVPPGFPSQKESPSFQKVEVEALLPCGVKRLLVQSEYNDLQSRVIRAENGRWEGAEKGTLILRVQAKLDYDLSSQPGTGVFPLFSVNVFGKSYHR